MPRNKVVEATKFENGWIVKVKDVMSEKLSTFYCKLLVNASGPWVQNVVTYTLKSNSYLSIRLVKGSHIVTKKLYQHEKCYFLLGKDGRIVFTIPYENDFTLIGTTEVAHKDLNGCLNCSADEKRYLLNFVNEYFDDQVTTNDVVWSYAGVRPLYDNSYKSSSAISRLLSSSGKKRRQITSLKYLWRENYHSSETSGGSFQKS